MWHSADKHHPRAGATLDSLCHRPTFFLSYMASTNAAVCRQATAASAPCKRALNLAAPPARPDAYRAATVAVVQRRSGAGRYAVVKAAAAAAPAAERPAAVASTEKTLQKPTCIITGALRAHRAGTTAILARLSFLPPSTVGAPMLDYRPARPPDHAFIAGASSGLGLNAANALARSGNWHVIMACRDFAKAEREAQKVGMPKGSYTVMHLDLASMESVRQFVHNFRASGRRLDALVANAAVYLPTAKEPTFTADGFELSVG